MALVSARMAQIDPKGDDRRSDQRTEINRTAVLRVANGAYDIQVADLTREGCKITTGIDLEVGSTVTLGFAGVGQVTAQIVWRDGEAFGCMFGRALPSGAVTAATLNNVDSLHAFPTVAAPVGPRDVKWSRGRQVAFIAGSSAVLWSVIIGTVALAF